MYSLLEMHTPDVQFTRNVYTNVNNDYILYCLCKFPRDEEVNLTLISS